MIAGGAAPEAALLRAALGQVFHVKQKTRQAMEGFPKTGEENPNPGDGNPNRAEGNPRLEEANPKVFFLQ